MKNYYYFGYCLPFWFFLKHYIKWSCLWMVSHALSFNILAGVPGVPRDDQWRNQIEFIFLYNQKDRIIFWKCLGDWLTVHHSITLVDIQLDAQNSCLFTYNTFIKILYMFRSDCPVHRLRKKTVTCRQWRYQRLHIYIYTITT